MFFIDSFNLIYKKTMVIRYLCSFWKYLESWLFNDMIYQINPRRAKRNSGRTGETTVARLQGLEEDRGGRSLSLRLKTVENHVLLVFPTVQEWVHAPHPTTLPCNLTHPRRLLLPSPSSSCLYQRKCLWIEKRKQKLVKFLRQKARDF